MATKRTSFTGRVIEVGAFVKTMEQIPVAVDYQAIALLDPDESTDIPPTTLALKVKPFGRLFRQCVNMPSVVLANKLNGMLGSATGRLAVGHPICILD